MNVPIMNHVDTVNQILLVSYSDAFINHRRSCMYLDIYLLPTDLPICLPGQRLDDINYIFPHATALRTALAKPSSSARTVIFTVKPDLDSAILTRPATRPVRAETDLP